MTATMDEYYGQGGTYLLDPKTGKRTLLERTEPAQPSELPTEDLSNAAPKPETPDPGKS